MKYYQQGDVVLIPTDKLQGKPLRGTVVQEGEHTGHAHRLDKFGQVFQDGETKFVRVTGKNGSKISHEEHDTFTIPNGDYEVRIVRQKDPFTKLVSKVID